MTASPARPAHTWLALALAWLAVGAPLLWGVAQTVRKALPLFS
jgi:predicted signal transduction protein with EAL and GGDEF domain